MSHVAAIFSPLVEWCNWKLWRPFFTSAGAWKVNLQVTAAVCYVRGGVLTSLNIV